MKRLLLIVIMLSIASLGYGQMMDVEEAVIEKEKQMYESIKSGDMETFESNLAENFMSVYEEGFSNREQEIASIKNLTIDSYEMSDIKVMTPAENIAMIVYTLNASGTWNQEKFEGKYYSTSTWMKGDDGNWKGIMHTETKASSTGETLGMEDER